MLQTAKIILRTLSARRRRQLLQLQLLVVFSAAFELLGVASIAPFMAVSADPKIIQENQWLDYAHQFVGSPPTRSFLIYLGIGTLILLVVSNAMAWLRYWALCRFGHRLGAWYGDRLFRYYISKPYLFHTAHNSATLIKNVDVESRRVTKTVVLPFLEINGNLVTVVFILGGLIIINPVLALVMGGILGLCYLLVFRSVRKHLSRIGRQISDLYESQLKLLNESYEGISEVKLLQAEDWFSQTYMKSRARYERTSVTEKIIQVTPRHVVEILAFGGVIVVTLYLLLTRSINDTLPILALYAMAGYRLLPSMHWMFTAAASIRVGAEALQAISDDLLEACRDQPERPTNPADKLVVRTGIQLEDVSFRYPSGDADALKNIDLTIEANTTVGFAGPSGCGKTTTAHIIVGLLNPDSGRIRVDNETLDEQNTRRWQQSIGFVPQHIFLADATIEDNIALGHSIDIDHNAVQHAAALANIDKFIHGLPDKFKTTVGERGVRLSGGQRQRITIARALYRDPPVLVFDEATSALDGMTEQVIMDSVRRLSNKRTVILIAHRLTTLRHCDVIHLFDNGQIVDHGTYDDLIERNEQFRKLATIDP
jgi:ABC-type bacteriocin/lantibiotic exporter with double-glycine peptidase domain